LPCSTGDKNVLKNPLANRDATARLVIDTDSATGFGWRETGETKNYLFVVSKMGCHLMEQV